MAQQQQMTAQIQAQLHRTTTAEEVCSPHSVGPSLPRMSSMSSVMSAPPRYGHYSPVAVNAMASPMSVGAQMSAMDSYRASRHTPGPSVSSMGSSVEDYALNAVGSSHDGSNASTDSLRQMVSTMMRAKGHNLHNVGGGGGGGHFRSPSVHSEGPTGTEMTEPPTAFSFNAVQAAKLRKKRKKKRMRDLERRLMTKDYDAKRKQMRDGLTAWDRFLDLMTPSFCSCSPAQPQATTMMPGKLTVQ